MRKSLFTLLILTLISSCSGQIEDVKNPPTTNKNRYVIDTILEKNDPKKLDLTKHQLYIDTTRTCQYYQKLLEWKPFTHLDPSILYYVEEIAKKHTPIKIELKDFPTLWVSLNKYQGEYILYDRCDGNDPIYGLTDSTFILFGPLESDATIISKVIKITKNELEIELRCFKTEENRDNKGLLKIKQTEKKDIYLLEYECNGWKISCYVTPVENIKNFDVIVNHCYDRKVIEFNNIFENQ